MNCVRVCLIVLISLIASAESMAQSALPEDVTLYAGGTLQFNGFSTISGGSVVAGGDVAHTGGSLTVDQISGAGAFSADGAAFQDSLGPVFFNRDITELGGPGSVIDGPVTSSQGSIDFLDTSTTINGNVTAANDIEFDFVFGTINGNVTAGGTTNITATVSGTTSTPTVATTPFAIEPLPPGRGLFAGTNDINLATFEDITLPPGTYGSLNFDSSNVVTLTAGSYIFENIVSDFSLNELSFDTTAGNIDLYIAADDVAIDLIQVIDGISLFNAGDPDPQLSRNVFIEVAGNLTIGSRFFGTFFAPNGDVTVENFADITGRVFAGGNVIIEDVDILSVEDVVVVSTDELGDANLDGAVNFLDLAPFINLLATNTYLAEADCNQDGSLNFLDIVSFIQLLTAN